MNGNIEIVENSDNNGNLVRKKSDDEKVEDEKNKEYDEEMEKFYIDDGWDVQEYKNIRANAEAALNFAGIFAGFEAFIMNTYVGMTLDSDLLSWAITGLAVSFICNIYASVNCICISIFIRLGYARKYFIGFIITSFLAIICAVISFACAFIVFMRATNLPDLNKGGLYVVFGVFSALILIFFGILSIGFLTEDAKRKKWLSKQLN